ncbi:hypothetical protein GIB67_042748 [Kingdonia uniflora]|uniref:Uncharacterized protein n=1 Tax=Kingdonia uniflora TaxID=39325 RepID=A0A7J7L0Y4_9MAGN|nr:hypothetical protein GIB67_042748 [Kingdonia uniflora]
MGSSSVNEVSTSGRTNESDNDREVGLEQFMGFPGQLVSYPPGSGVFREFCKAKATWKGKKSLLNEVAEEETKLELVLEGLGLSRIKRVDSKSDKVRKAQSTRSMAGVDEGKKKISCEEVRTKTPGSGSSAQPNLTTSKIAQNFLKKRILKSLPVPGATDSGEVANEKRMRVESSREKVVGVRPAAVDDLREVEERARLATFHEEEDTSKVVARLVKGIWLGIKEEKFELKKAKSELERDLARAKTEAMKEVKQLKAFHVVAISQLQVVAKANLDEMVEEHDRLGHHLMLKGYSGEEMDAIKADTYVEEGEDEEAEVVGIVDALDGLSFQIVLDNHRDNVELPKGGSEKVKEKDSEIKKGLKELSEVTERVKKLQRLAEALVAKGNQADMVQYLIQRRCDDLNERFTRLKAENDQAIARSKKAEARERSGGSRTEVKASLVQGDVVSLSGRIRELESNVSQIQGHVQKGNTNLRECQHKLDAALIREKVLEGEIKVKDLLVKWKEELLKDLSAREELNS